jgi:hypothetical protein
VPLFPDSSIIVAPTIVALDGSTMGSMLKIAQYIVAREHVSQRLLLLA